MANQIPYSDFKQLLVAEEPAYKSFPDRDIRKLYEEEHILSLRIGPLPETDIFLWLNDVQTGPFRLDQLKGMWSAGNITAATQYWFEGESEWKSVSLLFSPTTNRRANSSFVVQTKDLETAKPAGGGKIFVAVLAAILVAAGIIWLINGVSEAKTKHDKFMSDLDKTTAALKKFNASFSTNNETSTPP